MDKIATPDCQLFLSAYYAQSKVDTKKEDWILQKKYKNFHGFTCRDFLHEQLNIEAVVVYDKSSQVLSVMENSSYKTFLEEMARKPLFYYVPIITNDGLVFYFEKAVTFDARGKLDEAPQKQKPYLMKRLETVFPAENIATLGVGMIVAFPKLDLDEIIQKLETNKLSFNPKIFDFLNKELFQPIMPDISLAIFTFPEYDDMDVEQSIAVIFDITSKEGELNDEEYARIKKLLKKIPLEEIHSIISIAEGFRNHSDSKLHTLFESEINRKKNQILMEKLSDKSRKKK